LWEKRRRLCKGINMTRDIVIDALRMAWFNRHPSKQAGLVLHSESGSQYASKDFRNVLKECGMASSTTITTTPTANTLQRAPPR